MDMKRLTLIGFIFLMACLMIACAKPTEPSGMIEPGDKVGDFLVTTGEEGNFTYGFDLDCSEEGSEQKADLSCKSTVGDIVNITTGIYDDTHSGKLEEYWSNSNYQLFIEGRPVDLQAFGTVEYKHPVVGVIRFWNVVISTHKPGEINVHDLGVAGDLTFEYTSSYAFSAP